MNQCADYTPSPSNPSAEPAEPRASQAALQQDVDMGSGSSGNETNENGSTGRDSRDSDCDGSSRELGLLVGPRAQGWVWLVFSESHSVVMGLLLQSLSRDDQVSQDF